MEKTVTRDQMNTILEKRPTGVSGKEVIDTYLANGYKIEGINYEKPVPEQTLGSKLIGRAKDLGHEVAAFGTLGASTLSPEDIAMAKGDKNQMNLLALQSGLRAAEAPIRAVGAVGGAVGDIIGAGLSQIGADKAIGSAISPVLQNEQVKKAVDLYNTLPQDTKDVLGAIVNTTNLAGTGELANIAKIGTKGAINVAKDVSKTGVESLSKLTPDAEAIMQRVARVSKGKQANFEQQAGESIGSFLDKRGIYGDVDQITEQLYNRFQQSKNNADEALSQLGGNYQPVQVKTALTKLQDKLKSVSSEGAVDPQLGEVSGLLNKLNNQGLTMSEINQAKRLYERNVKLDFLKENNVNGVREANNIDNAIREWQFNQAERLGLKNLPEINKETRLTKQLLDDLGKEYAGSAGNNAMSLTDWIMISGGDAKAVAGLLAKKGLSDKKIQSFIAEKLSKNKDKINVPSGEFTTPQILPIGTYKDFLKETSKNSKPLNQLLEGKVSQSSLKSTPSEIKSKGIRGMINFGEIGVAFTPSEKKVVTQALKDVQLGKSEEGRMLMLKPVEQLFRKEGLITKSETLTSNEIEERAWKALDDSNGVIGKAKEVAKEKAMSTKGVKDMEARFDTKKAVNSLEQEAKGKTLEEFIKNNTQKVYHGTNDTFDTFDPKKGAQGVIWFTDDVKTITSGESGAQGTKNIMERYLTGKKFAGWNEYENLMLDQIKSLGFDGIKLPNGKGGNDYVLFDNKGIKTKSQLIDIWNKAHGK